MKILRKLVRAQIDALGDDEVEVVMSTAALARDGHILIPRGCELNDYRANPIVLWQHSPDTPIGNAENIVVTADKITARIRFAPLGVSPKADEIRGLMKAGVIRAVSVGFDAIEMEPLDPKNPRGGQRITAWTLLELSAVSVPADPGAVVTQRSILAVEASLRAAGMPRAKAKAEAYRRIQSLSELEGLPMPANNALARALDRFAPSFRYIAEGKTHFGGPLGVNELLKARAAITDGLDTADRDNWDRNFDLANEAVAELDSLIRAARARQTESSRTARPVGGQENHGAARGGWGGAPLLRDVATGRMIRTYRHDEPVASDGGQPEWGVGDMVRAACTGDWSRLPSNVRAGSAGIGASGGFLVPSELAGWVIDLARAKARVLQAGAQTVPMDRGNLSVAVVTGDPQAGWKAENAAFQTSQGSYGLINLSVKTLGVIVPLSLELVMSAANLNEIVTTQLTKALGLQLDTAAIAGDGTVNQPRGVIPNIPAEQVFDVGAALTSATAYSYWSKAIGKVLAANAELSDLAILHNSDVETALDGLQDTLNQPLRPTPNYAEIRNAGRVYVANGILTSGSPAATYSVVGDWRQVLFGMQQSLSIEVSREGSYENGDGTWGNAWAQGQVLVRAMIMCDVAVMRPTFFSQVNEIQV